MVLRSLLGSRGYGGSDGLAPRWRRLATSSALALGGLVASLLVFQTLRFREHRVLSAEFHKRAHERTLAIKREFETAKVVVESLASFLTTSTNIDRAQFRAFTMPLLQRHGSLQAVGLDRVVPAAARASFEASMREQGYADFRITELNSNAELVPAARRKDYVVVTFIEPLNENRAAVGYDIASEGVRNLALQRTWASGELSATGPVRLVQEPKDQMGFLLCGPVYRGGAYDALNRDSVVAFAVGVFRVGDLVDNALGHLETLGIDFLLTDETAPGRNQILYQHDSSSVGLEARRETAGHQPARAITATESIDLAGRDWRLVLWPTGEFVSAYLTWWPLIALLIGWFYTGLLVAYFARLNGLNDRLRASEQRFRGIAENIRDVFWMMEPQGSKHVYVSPAYEEIWGRRARGLVESPESFVDSVLPEDQQRVRASMAKQRRGIQTAEEYRIRRPDGSLRWIWDRAFPVLGAGGIVTSVVGIAEDITQRKRDQDERAQFEQKMQQTQRLESLGVLAGGIAHDFNNLLTAIVGHASLATACLPPDHEARDDVAKIEEASLRAAELANQMLAYSGRGKFVEKYLNLSALVAEMARLIDATVTNKVISRYDLIQDLPSIKGDASQLGQLVMNLITNAAEAIDGPAGEIRISTGVMKGSGDRLEGAYLEYELTERSYIYLQVEDTGCGMDRDTMQQIFEPFFTTKLSGRGLGLAAALGIVRGHDGGIAIHSKPAQGTRVLVIFPAVDEVAVAAPEILPNNTARPHNEGSVLIIDDEDVVRETARAMLKRWGLTALMAKDGIEGLEILESHRDEISVVLLDLTMPTMHGMEVFGHIRELAPALPVILSSGYSRQELQERFGSQGFSAFIQKPYRFATLVDCVNDVLGSATGVSHPRHTTSDRE